MTKITSAYNNFSRGKIDHDMNGRFDLPVYRSGLDVCRNFTTNFKGNAIYRTGYESLFLFQDCFFIEFKFNKEQQYICAFYENKVRFLSYDSLGNFGWVLDGGAAILEVDTPYTLEESKHLVFTQNDDVMVVTHDQHDPRKMVRVSANEFTFNQFGREDDPFVTSSTGAQTITAITQAAEAQITITAHTFNVGDTFVITGVTGMTEINDYSAPVLEVVDVNNVKVGIDTTKFTAYTSGGSAATVDGTDYPRCCLFYKGRLYYAGTPERITTVFGSVSGLYDDFSLTPVDVTSALILTIADISQTIEWLFPGSNSLIAGASDGIVAINGGGVGVAITAETVAADLTDAPPTARYQPLSKDGFVFYVGLNRRNIYYFNYDLLSESFVAKDANFLSYDITQGMLGKIRFKKDRDDLIYSVTDNGLILTCNFKAEENINGWHEHLKVGDTFEDQAVITDNNGEPQIFSLTLRNGSYYIERQGKRVEFAEQIDFYTGFGLTDLSDLNDARIVDEEAYNRFIAEQLKECIYLDNSSIVSGLQEGNNITYTGLTKAGSLGVIVDTDGIFTSDDVGKHIVYKTETGYESGRFEITGYTDANTVDVEVLQVPTAITYNDWYLSFKTITGLTQYNGQTVAVVTDGGFLTTFEVTDGTIEFNNYNTTHAVIGYQYLGFIKSFALGFQVNAENTQITDKNIAEFGLRFVASAGGKCGESLYKLEPVQKLTPNILNYLPPIPMDGTKRVNYSGNSKVDKFFYVVQDEPLPMTLTNAMIKSDYTLST